MIINKICIITITIIIIAKAINCHVAKQPAPQLQGIVASYPDCNAGNVDSTGKVLDSGLRFRLPVLDTIIHNDRKMQLMQEMRQQWIFLLHGYDLQQLFISREKTNLTLVGRLDDSVWKTQHLDAQLITWRNYLLLVIAFERNLIIYEINGEILVKRKQQVVNSNNATVPFFEPIQQLTMPGIYRKMYLVEPVKDKILLILAVDETEFSGRIKTYEWINTYFEPVEELMMPTLNVVNQLQNYLIVGRTIRHTSETILSMYEILPNSLKLMMRQTLTVQSKNPHFVSFREKNYLIACSKDHVNCIVYKKVEGQYELFRQRPSKDLAFTHFIAGKHFLVGSRDNEVVVVSNARLNCYVSFSSNDADVSSVMTHINEQGENFILLNYVRPTQTLLRIVEIENRSGENLNARAAYVDDEEELKPNPKYRIFEETIGRLRSILLQHNAAMTVFRKISNVFEPKLKTIKVKYPVTVKAGHIGIVKIAGKDLRSPVQLLKRLADLGQRFGSAQRSRRFAVENNASETSKKPTRLKAQRLRVKHLVYNGNIVEGFHLDAAAKPLPILSIRPLIKTKFLNTPELMLPRRYPSAGQQSLGLFDFIESSLTMRTRELNVTSINNIPWAELYDSLFLKNRDKRIEGRLVMQAATKINTLRTPLLNGLVVKNLFNLVEKQVIHSNLVLAGFNVSDLQADTVNGLDFANDVVFSGRDTFIKSPVVMHDLNISGDFLLDNDPKLERSFDVRSEDLQHVYTGEVIINGTLTLNNLLLEDVAELIVNGESLAPQNLQQHYLLHKTEQEFEAPLIFGNALVTTPNLSTTYLNDHPTEQHLLKKTGQPNPNDTLLIIYMDAEIPNDLICNAYTSHLANISREAVRHGEVANITGFKNFEGDLSINHLMTLELNDLPVHQMILKSQLKRPLTLKGPKFFEKIQVRNETNIELELEVNNLNSLPLRELLNHDFHLDNLTLPHELLATNVVFHKINGISFDEIFMNLKVSADENLVLHKDLIIEGNAQFSENLVVDMVNNVEWTKYQQSLVRLHEHAVIGGQKSFLSELVVTKALNTPTLNNLSIAEIFSNVLSRTKPQIIKGSYTFDELEVSNMDVAVINDMPTASFIDTRSQEIEIESNIVVPKVSLGGNIQGDLGNALNLSTLELRLQQLPAKQWRNVHVLGNAHWNESRLLGGNNDNAHKLAYLEKYAVTQTGNHVISGNVKLRRPIISQMVTKTAFPKDIDFEHIARDCLLKEGSREQVVTAPKTFHQPLNMQNLEATAVVGCNKINNIDILRLNASLYRLSSGEPLMGPLHFMRPPIVGHLAVQGNTNGLSSAQVYHAPNQRVPPITIAQLDIDNTLQLSDINDMSFDYFLQNRVTKEGPALEIFGFLTFENLVLNKEMLLQSINGIPIDSLIFKTSDSLQALTGAKTIEGDLILAGPAHVLRLNNEELIDSYQKSIFKHLNYHFDNLVIDEATFERGLLANTDEVMLAAPLPESQSRLALKYAQRKRLNAIEHDLAAIDSMISVGKSLSNKSRHLIYIDYGLEAQIMWQAANKTIDKSYSFERQRLSMCERQSLLVQMTSDNKRLFLSNATSSLLRDDMRGWHVKLENFCSSNAAGKARSKITLTSANFTKSFELKKYIENVKIFQPAVNQTHLILHAIDLLGKRNEVRLLKISPNKVEDLQSLAQGIGRVLKLFQITSNYSLLISSALSDNYPTLSIYTYSTAKERFALAQVIDGDYDIIELVPLSAERYHLILSCVHCHRISVFEFNANAAAPQRYRIYQFIKPNQLIDKLVPFTAGDGSHYLLVLSEHGQDYYHLYKFSHIQGWLHFTYGYFNNIQLALPLVAQGSQLAAGENALLLLCGSHNNCQLVKAYMQQ